MVMKMELDSKMCDKTGAGERGAQAVLGLVGSGPPIARLLPPSLLAKRCRYATVGHSVPGTLCSAWGSKCAYSKRQAGRRRWTSQRHDRVPPMQAKRCFWAEGMADVIQPSSTEGWNGPNKAILSIARQHMTCIEDGGGVEHGVTRWRVPRYQLSTANPRPPPPP